VEDRALSDVERLAGNGGERVRALEAEVEEAIEGHEARRYRSL
jgi:hypothetical protein